jgi:trimethylamine--corrinoid protein Co-methyltransferase
MNIELTILNQGDVKKIHQESVRVLETLGVYIPHKQTLRLFEGAGARVDRDRKLVRIPEKVVAKCLEMSGKKFTLYGRDRKKRAEFGSGKRNYQSIGGNPYWIEDDLLRRPSTLKDVATSALIGDALPQLTIVGAMSDANDVPESYRYLCIAAELLKHTTKPIMFFFNNRATSRFIMDLFEIVAGSKQEVIEHPLGYFLFEPISPLRYPLDGIDLLYEICPYRIPVAVAPLALMGATAPGTLAGTIVQQNAEILAGICVVQLIEPGIPIAYGGIPHALDMSTTSMIAAGPEQSLMTIAMTQLGKFYNLPVYVDVGISDSKIQDAQAGLEAGITLVCGAMAGADIFGSFGSSGEDQGTSLLMLLIQHELIGFTERLMNGFEISDEKIGFTVIEKAREEGNFLAEEHTLNHFRQELWFPKLVDRNFWDTWFNGGKKDMRTRCIELKDTLLKEHASQSIERSVAKEIEKLLVDAKEHLGN